MIKVIKTLGFTNFIISLVISLYFYSITIGYSSYWASYEVIKIQYIYSFLTVNFILSLFIMLICALFLVRIKRSGELEVPNKLNAKHIVTNNPILKNKFQTFCISMIMLWPLPIILLIYGSTYENYYTFLLTIFLYPIYTSFFTIMTIISFILLISKKGWNK